jgi:hypothetical protein
VLFAAVDTGGTGTVGAAECAALVREVLDGGVGLGGGAGGAGASGARSEAVADFLRELADEGPAVREQAIAAEAADMMAWARGEPPRLDFDGFAGWLAAFMEGVADDAFDHADELGDAGRAGLAVRTVSGADGADGVAAEEDAAAKGSGASAAGVSDPAPPADAAPRATGVFWGKRE